MFFKKEYQVIKCNPQIIEEFKEDNSILFVKVSEIVNTKNAILEVADTMNALVIKGGGDCRFYKSGNYPLFDSGKEVKDWKKGLSVDIIYMPKDTRLPISWGTKNRASYRDRISNKVVEIGARGSFDVCIAEGRAEQFYRRIIGVQRVFDKEAMEMRCREMVMEKFFECFFTVLDEQQLTYDQFSSAAARTISPRVGKAMTEKLRDYCGIEVTNFLIEEIFMPDKFKEQIEGVTEEAARRERLKEYLAELERLDDKQWEREKYLRQHELQDKAAYYEVLKVIGNKNVSVSDNANAKYCPHCSHPNTGNGNFCTKCGRPMTESVTVTCPSCGTNNAGTSRFCSACGYQL